MPSGKPNPYPHGSWQRQREKFDEHPSRDTGEKQRSRCRRPRAKRRNQRKKPSPLQRKKQSRLQRRKTIPWPRSRKKSHLRKRRSKKSPRRSPRKRRKRSKLQKRRKPLLNPKSERKRSSRSLKRNSMISIFDEYGMRRERKGLQELSDSFASLWLKG